MKNKILIIPFLLILTSTYAQSNKIGNRVSNIEFIRSMTCIEGDFNDYFTDLVERSMFSKKDSLKYGFINSKGEDKFKKRYTYASDFFNDKSNIIIDSIPGLLFINGKQKMFSEYDATYWYKDKLGVAIKNNKYGFINTEGKVIVPMIYDNAFPFYKGYASVKVNNKWNYINEKGRKVFSDSLIFSYRPIINNRAVFMVEGKGVEKNKKMTSENGSRTFVEFLNKTGHIQLKEGLINIDGKILLEPIYDEISGYFKKGYMKVKNNGNCGIIDKNNKVVIPIDYEGISDYKRGLFLAKKNNKWGMIDVKNKIIIPFKYKKIRHFREGLAYVKLRKKSGYINKRNEMIITSINNYIFSGDFKKGVTSIRSNGKRGFLNKKSEITIPVIYDTALLLNKRKVLVKKNGMSFLLNKKGEKIEKKILKPYLWMKRDELVRFAE